MKAKEAPEKLYVHRTIYLGLLEASEMNITGSDIEYTRTDAFIEKACKWFRDIDYDDSMPPFETTEEFIEGFKKAMKL